MDGAHRLVKALHQGVATIDVRIVSDVEADQALEGPWKCPSCKTAYPNYADYHDGYGCVDPSCMH